MNIPEVPWGAGWNQGLNSHASALPHLYHSAWQLIAKNPYIMNFTLKALNLIWPGESYWHYSRIHTTKIFNFRLISGVLNFEILISDFHVYHQKLRN